MFIASVTLSHVVGKLKEEPEQIIKGTTWEQRVERLEANANQNKKDWDSLLNYYCLSIQHYADDTQVMVDDSIRWNPGRCEEGFRN